LGDGGLIPIEYGFWRGKFYVGMVITKGVPDWNVFKEAVFHEFREGAKSFTNKQWNLGLGKNASMASKYSETSETGIFYLRSDSMTNQMERYRAEVR
jgi:hypothetical protein